MPEAVAQLLVTRNRCSEGGAAARPPRVDPAADHREHGREREDGRGHGQQHDRDAGVGERPQEEHGEHEQGGQGGGDGQGADHHGPAGGLDRLHHGVVRREPVAQLLPVAGDDEQAVVDAQAEPQRGGEVDGEHRHVGDRPEQEQHQERAEDSHRADEERQRGAHDAAEHEHEQEQGQRDGDHFGPCEGGLDRVAELLVHRRRPAHRHLDGALPAPQAVPDLGHGLVGRVVLGGDPAQHQRLVTARVAQRRRSPQAPVRGHVGDVRGVRQTVGQRCTRAGDRRVVDAAGRGTHEQHEVRVTRVEHLVQGVGGPCALGAGIVEAAALEHTEGTVAEADGGDGEQGAGGEHQPASPHGEPGQSGEHGASSCRSLSPCAR